MELLAHSCCCGYKSEIVEMVGQGQVLYSSVCVCVCVCVSVCVCPYAYVGCMAVGHLSVLSARGKHIRSEEHTLNSSHL